MKVIALRRNPNKSDGDSYCSATYGSDKESLCRIMRESDYILATTPLTKETQGMINEEVLPHAREDAVFINLGRGAVVDEVALANALRLKRLKGAALDVFTVEPLPKTSPFGELENVLISP